MMSIPFAQASFPEMYEKALVGPLFRPWADLTLDEIGLRPGDRVLDVACGTGTVARQAKARLGDAGTVVGVDVSGPMLAVARRAAPNIDWREGDAAALPLRDGEQFDVVICQQGLQFFADRCSPVREMYRALAPGGRVAVSTWRPDDEIPFGRELRRIAEHHLGPVIDRRHCFGETGPLEAVLRDAGFRDVQSKTLSTVVRFADGTVFVHMNAMALVGMSQAGKTLSDEQRQHLVQLITKDSEAVRQHYTDGEGLAFEIRSNIARGTK
jgi:ubiquinone/menaquinone biosynthesis C-methylase UbiE